jgi:serine/threonine protein kinase
MRFLHYELLEQIGAGGQGVVWSALEKENNRIVAIKFIETSNQQIQAVTDNMFDQQGHLFSQLEHPNILPLYDFGILGGLRFLVSLYVPGGSLQDQLATGRLPVETSLTFAAHIASALDYLHSHDIIHRDLKPGNVLMDLNHNIYVFDFGLARIISDSTMAMHTGHGTLPYSPPEQSSHSEITVQSDLYSFGVMLYQFFTGHIPWDGEIALGIQQLHSNEEIPDPREYDPGLPPALVTALRRITAAERAERPKSASEVIQMLYDVFNVPPIPVDEARRIDVSPPGLGTDEIIKRALTGWDISSPAVPLTLTKFALVGVGQKTPRSPGGPENLNSLLLHCALVYGYDCDYWWKKVENPKERLRIATALIRPDNLALANRSFTYLLKDQAILRSKIVLADGFTLSLLDIAGSTVSQDLKQSIFEFLEKMIQPLPHWQTSIPDTRQVQALAHLACENTPIGDRAARLIGRLHSTQAVAVLLTRANEVRRNRALFGVLEAAGSLPSNLPRNLRLSLSMEWLANWLASNLASLLGVYGLAALGVFLGFGAQVYLTYRLPNYMDLTRISVAVERGLFMGFAFGFGIFVTRLLSEILPSSKTLVRMAIATLVGGTILTVGLLLYDILFLNTLPGGVLFAAGCFFISAGYAFAQWVRPVAAKISITGMVIFLALIGTWFGHIAMAPSPTGLAPIFFYDYGWPMAQILGTMLVASLPMAVFGSLGKIPRR